MATAQDIISIERSWIGRTEKPANSNHVFVWDMLIKAGLAPSSFQGQPWCRAKNVASALKAKAPILPVQSPYYCPSVVQYARTHEVKGQPLWLPARQLDKARPGDESMWAFTWAAQRAGLAEHVERLERIRSDVCIEIGGNTSSGVSGSQDNGGGVYERRRPADAMLLGFVRYSLLLDHEPTVRRIKRNPYLDALRAAHLPIRQGARGDAVRGVQWAVGVPVDGDFGPLTEHGVRHFQRYHQDRLGRALIPDGEVGKLTFYPLVRITHWQH